MEVNTPPPYENRNEEQRDKPVTNVYVQNVVPSPRKNSLGIAGFTLSLVALVLGWFPHRRLDRMDPGCCLFWYRPLS